MENVTSKLLLHYLPLPNGEVYAYREIGTGPKTILLLHGVLSTSLVFDTLAPLLSKHFHVIFPDMRGFGHTSYNQKINNHHNLANDIKLFIETLGLKKFSIFGWSTGGGVAAMVTAKYPEFIENLIMCCPIEPTGYVFYKMNEDGNKEPYDNPEELVKDQNIVYIMDKLRQNDREAIKKILDMANYNIKKPSEAQLEGYIDEVMLQRNHDDIGITNQFFNFTEKDTSYSKAFNLAKDIKARTLILQGENDIVVPLTDNWLKILKPELTTQKIFKNCGHSPFVDCLDELAETIITFINYPEQLN